jgi:microcompartment protein CcmK/EutM
VCRPEPTPTAVRALPTMLIGEVVGSVVATRKDPGLGDQKLLVLQIRDHENRPKDQYVVAVDAVGAGHGDIVLYAAGSSARQTQLTKDKPCDAVIMAIVDSWDLGGNNVYEKWA